MEGDLLNCCCCGLRSRSSRKTYALQESVLLAKPLYMFVFVSFFVLGLVCIIGHQLVEVVKVDHGNPTSWSFYYRVVLIPSSPAMVHACHYSFMVWCSSP